MLMQLDYKFIGSEGDLGRVPTLSLNSFSTIQNCFHIMGIWPCLKNADAFYSHFPSLYTLSFVKIQHDCDNGNRNRKYYWNKILF